MGMKKKLKIRALAYDPLLYPFLHPIRSEVASTLISWGAFDKKILDLCCGTGNQLKILSENGFRDLYGVDISPAMTEVAEKNHSSLHIYTEDAVHTGFDSARFDIILISFGIHEKDDETGRALLNEAYRLLKKDGFLVIVDYEFVPGIKPFTRFVLFFIERMAGRYHFRNFRDYLEKNGLNTIIDEKKYTCIQRRSVLFNSTVFAVYTKSEADCPGTKEDGV